ncbi:MAG: hypothetical protein ACHQU0_02610 [Candidatus Paceibacteria bacterium]
MAKKSTGKTVMKVGAGLAAAGAAAAAGYYFYASDGAKKHRKIAAAWATKMKKEIMKEAKLLEKESPKAFATIVDRIAKTYETATKVNAADVKRAAKELKENWDMVQREAKKTVKKSVSRAKATAKKTVKKVAKRAK